MENAPFEPPMDIPLREQSLPEPVVATKVSPRSWTPFAVMGISLASYLLASFVMLFVAIVVVHGEISLEILQDQDALKALAESRAGLLITLVVPQLALVTPAVVAAVLSPVPIRQRLGLVRGHWPVWTWFAAAAATPVVSMVAGSLLGVFMEKSETLEDMGRIFREHGENGFLIPLVLMIGVTPSICEELLFRGYVQTRLVRSMGPLAGVTIASVLFAVFHLDFVHILAVLPLGLFLGWVSWQSGSIFPAMLGHFVNNSFSVVAAVKIAPMVEENKMPSIEIVAMVMLVVLLGFAGLASVSVASLLYGRPQSEESGTAPGGGQPV